MLLWIVCIARKSFHYKIGGDPFMNNNYMECEDLVYFEIKSDYDDMDTKIALPLSLVEDLKEHMTAFYGVVSFPFDAVILRAFITYMNYIHCDLIPFDDHIKELLKAEHERDMQQEDVVV